MSNQRRKLSKWDVTKAWIRWYISCEMSNSYERLQTVAFCYMMAPLLEKLYQKKEDLVQALKRHLVFFNTQGIWGGVIHGATIAMEEQKAMGEEIPDEAIIGLKTGLMGPFAGIGDTIDWATLRTICIALFIPMATNGSWLAGILPIILFTGITLFEGYTFWHLGYNLGRESVRAVLESGWVNQLITGASVLGLFMMGALSANYVSLTTPITFSVGESVFALQDILDNIIPGILPLLLVFGIYYYLQNVGRDFTKILLFLLVLGIGGGVIGLF